MPDRIAVLCIDDDRDVVELTATFLERESERFDVDVATAPELVLADTEFSTYDCLVCDYDMPEIDGLELLEAVREGHPELPVILFTGRGSEEVASEAISRGVTDYLQKGRGTEQYLVLANRIQNAVGAYRAQRERRRHLRAIETATEGISILDESGHFLFVNEAYADLYGYDREAMVGEHWSLVYPAEEVETISDEILPQVRADGYWQGETRGRRADGSTFLEDHRLTVTDSGELVCTVRDLSEHRARVRRFEAIFHNTYTFVGLLDPDGTLIEANETALRFADVDREEVLGNPLWETHWFQNSPRSREVAREAVETARKGELFRDELAVQGRDQTAIIDFTVRPVRNDAGEITLLVPEGRDITERRETSRRLETLMETVPGILYRCAAEPGWPIEELRGQVEAITGHDPATLVENSERFDAQLIHPDDRELVRDAVTAARDSEESFTVEYRLCTADGTTIDVWERGRWRFDLAGEPIAIEGYITDVLPRRDDD